jgi:hypothetical protein
MMKKNITSSNINVGGDEDMGMDVFASTWTTGRGRKLISTVNCRRVS